MGYLLVGAIATLSGVLLLFGTADRIRARRRYRTVVGRTLDDLVRLLPAHLQVRTYTGYVTPTSPPGSVLVGLLYEDPGLRRGAPPNVGLEFDAATGELLKLYEDGIGLGIK